MADCDVLAMVTLRRIDLPIVSACPAELELQPDADGRSWCERCAKPVHVLGSLREHEVRSLLAAHAGRSLCVEYRARKDGTIVLRRDAARAWLATTLVGLAACSTASSTTTTAVPDDATATTREGCPLPAAPAAETQASLPGERVMVANFRIDERPPLRGMIVLDGVDDNHRADRSDRLEWIPTKTLWRQFVARVRARRARAGA